MVNNTFTDENSIKRNHYPVKIGNLFKLSFGEEVGNSVSHGVAAMILLFALPACAIYGYQKSGKLLAFGYSIYIISLLLMFLASCLYHAMDFNSKHKQVFRILDHSAIYIAIAGTFTPICLSVVGGWLGIVVLICQWVTAIFGILFKSLSKKNLPKASLTIYLVMGWSAILLLPAIIHKQLWGFLAFILLGGLLYTIGTIFYSKKEKSWFHFIWHLFVIAASAAHFVAIIFYI